MPYLLASHVSFEDAGYLYVLGGSARIGNSRSEIIRSLAQLDGLLPPWQIDSHFPLRLIYHSIAKQDDSVYVLGGYFDNIDGLIGFNNKVYLAKLQAGGGVGAWQEVASLPMGLGLGGSVIINNRLYYAGGTYGSQNQNVYVTNINADGTLTGWTVAGTLPYSLEGFGMMGIDGRILIAGGRSDNSGGYMSKVQLGIVNSDGTIASWVEQPELPASSYRGGLARVGNQLIFSGGVNGSGYSDKVYLADILENGDISDWTLSTNKLPSGNCCFSTAVSGNYLYIFGGHDGGQYLDTVWRSSVGPIPTSSPLPSPTINPTPTPTLIPTPTPLPLLILIPGGGASWNSEAMLHNKTNIPDAQWKIPSFIKTYDGLIKTIKDLGYSEGKNFFVYAYDWRRPINITGTYFANFVINSVLTGRPDGTKVNIVGHSEGGLVARKFGQLNSDRVNKLITVGTPHEGVANFYNTWEGGLIEGLSWDRLFGIEIILGVNRSRYPSRVSEIQNMVPSLKQMLPVENYLMRPNGSYINIGDMVVKNTFLPALNDDLFYILPKLSTLSGKGFTTLRSLIVVPRNSIDKLADKWVDGKPVNRLSSDGDNTVLLGNGLFQNGFENVIMEGLDHEGLVQKATGISNILQLLDLPENSQEQPFYKNKKMIIVTVLSPATFVVVDPDGLTTSPTDGVVVIPDPKDGNYLVKLTSTGRGQYTVLFGRTNGATDGWSEDFGFFSKKGQQASYEFKVKYLLPKLGADPYSDIIKRLKKFRKYEVCRLLEKYFEVSRGRREIPEWMIKSLDNLTEKVVDQTEKSEFKVIRRDIERYLED